MVDALAVESQRRAATAWAEGRFAKSVITIHDQNGLPILATDEYMRPGTDMQSLGALKASFKDMGESMPGFDKVAMMKYPHLERIDHIHHAGNSSGIVDGAAALLIGGGSATGFAPLGLWPATLVAFALLVSGWFAMRQPETLAPADRRPRALPPRSAASLKILHGLS